ncbi:MAG: hypothetical protein RLW62_05775 [Gammaproteobacteria bacterium]
MRVSACTALLLAAPLLTAQEATPEMRTQLKQAFDGAMTCSALTAMEADKALGDMQQTWANRSFAFGMLAVRFYTDLSGEPLRNEDMNTALNEYADALLAMSEEQLAPFRSGCAEKYPRVDALCEENDCVFPRKPAAAPEALAPTD